MIFLVVGDGNRVEELPSSVSVRLSSTLVQIRHGDLRLLKLTSIFSELILYLSILLSWCHPNLLPLMTPSMQASDIVPHVLASPAVVLAAQHFKEQLLTVISNQNPALPTTGTRELERPRESVSTARSVYVTQGERASPLPQYVQVSPQHKFTDMMRHLCHMRRSVRHLYHQYWWFISLCMMALWIMAWGMTNQDESI